MDIIWKDGYSIDEQSIELVERLFDQKFPTEYKQIVKNHNYAYPSKNAFDTELSREHVFNHLLSFNTMDVENVYKAKALANEYFSDLFPFANDPAGNFICFQQDKIVYWDYEMNELYFIANSFVDFINMLYD